MNVERGLHDDIGWREVSRWLNVSEEAIVACRGRSSTWMQDRFEYEQPGKQVMSIQVERSELRGQRGICPAGSKLVGSLRQAADVARESKKPRAGFLEGV